MDKQIYDVIIIGAGPSGLTAAIYTSRAFLTTLVLAGSPSGGQLAETTDVENFPGFPEGVLGPELIAKLRSQAEKFKTEFLDVNATSINKTDAVFIVTDSSGDQHTSKALIIATGASAKWLGIESETRLRGKGVSACATCDGYFFKGKDVAVIGGGDAAMEEAIFLTKFATKVYVLVRGSKEELRASKIMQQRAFDNPNIEFLYNTEIREVVGDQFVTGLKIFNNKTFEEKTLAVQGLFVAIGHKPNTDFLQKFVDLDPKGYIVVSGYTKTSVEGAFVAGDVADHKYRQAITAAGAGCMAALDAEKYLSEKSK